MNKSEENIKRVEEPSSKGDRTLLERAVQFSILLVFLLYVIGTLIWNAHLGTSAVIFTDLLQLKLLSAAICFFAVGLLAVAPFLCFFYSLTNLAPQHDGSWSIYTAAQRVMPATWAYLSLSFLGSFYVDVSWTWTFAILTLVLTASVAQWKLWVKAGKRLRATIFLVLLIISYILVPGPCLAVKGLPLTFFITIVTLMVVEKDPDIFHGHSIASVIAAWKARESILHIYTWPLFTIGLWAFLFGYGDFNRVANVFGGGKPEPILLKFKPEAEHLAAPLGLIRFKTSGSQMTNGWYPSYLLIKTQSEYILSTNLSTMNSFAVPVTLVDAVRFLPPTRTNRVLNLLTGKH